MSQSRRPMMANHNRSWIWGRNVVLETLRAARWSAIELLYSERCEESIQAEVVSIAKNMRIPAFQASDQELTKRCRSEEHQGLAARMPPFPYLGVRELLGQLPEQPALVMLDRVQDSYNFGAIIRSADVLGIDGVIVGDREQAQVNSLAARSSVGAVNYVPIAQSTDLVRTVVELRERGFQIIGTSDRASESVFDPDYRRATVLIIGNEGHGIQSGLQEVCTQFVQIPVLGKVNSLNAAVSAGILFYEVLRQRRV